MPEKKNILIIGAGRSSTALIECLLSEAQRFNWQLLICDAEEEVLQPKIKEHSNVQGIVLNILEEQIREVLIQSADIVISMLPAHMHHIVALDCLKYSKNLVTASYWTKDLLALDERVKTKGIFFMGELGLDPGIDHMSAMKKIDEIHQLGGTIQNFRSYTGGLIAPESDNNPWHYKITWNPRNIVLAGKGITRFLESGKIRYIPYHRLFKNYRKVNIANWGTFEVYPNRDSLKYQQKYGLNVAEEVYRGTIRHQGFCDAWDVIVQMGLADEEMIVENDGSMTYQDWIAAFFAENKDLSSSLVELIDQGDIHNIIDQLKWLGLFDRTIIPFSRATSAQILEDLLLKKWRLYPDDKDLVLMQHEFEYQLDGLRHSVSSTMSFKGENAIDTAMTKLVGLPLAIFVKKVLLNEIKLSGIHIPINSEVYLPILDELQRYGVSFQENKLPISG